MSHDVILPALGESVTEGTITEWFVSVGDTVEADQPLFELSSDKVDTEVPAPVAGTVIEILVNVDETAEVGSVVARIGEAGAAPVVSEPAPEPAPAAAPEPTPVPAAEEAPAAAPAAGGATTDVTLPELGESVTEGTITTWLVAVGDTVEADQPIFEISSDKIDTEVPAPVAGTIVEILANEDDTVAVGAVVARIGAAGAAPAAAAPAPAAAPAAVATPAPAAAPAATPAGDVYASPLVRQLAAEKGLDLSTITGTGEGGRVTREDVEAAGGAAPAPAAAAPAPVAAAAPAAAVAPAGAPAPKAATPAPAATGRVRIEKMNRIRGKIAEKMLESQEKAAQLTTFQEVDVTNLMAARGKVKDAFKKREGISLSPFALVARAAVIASKNHPLINAYADWDTMELHVREYVNLGIAVDTDKGLLVPNIKNAQNLTVAGIAQGIADLAAKARGEGGAKIDFADIQNGTMTLTNTGSRGVLFDTPILNYPEVAILGVGAIVKRPAIVKGANGEEFIGIRDMMYLSLSYDHRLLDGADAARYVTEVKQVIESLDWDRELA